jgi:hypothetical protein
MSILNQTALTESDQITLSKTDNNSLNIFDYITISLIQSTLPKDYVKMILEETICQINFEESIFTLNSDSETDSDENGYYNAIIKINKWYNNEITNEILNELICDNSYIMNDYGWIIEKYDNNKLSFQKQFDKTNIDNVVSKSTSLNYEDYGDSSDCNDCNDCNDYYDYSDSIESMESTELTESIELKESNKFFKSTNLDEPSMLDKLDKLNKLDELDNMDSNNINYVESEYVESEYVESEYVESEYVDSEYVDSESVESADSLS